MPGDERTILAYFPTRGKALAAVKALKAEGFETLQLDRVSQYPGDGTDVRRNPLTGEIPGLAELTLGAEGVGRDAAVLLSADPSASGMATDTSVTELPYLVTVVCPDERSHLAVRLLEENGGSV